MRDDELVYLLATISSVGGVLLVRLPKSGDGPIPSLGQLIGMVAFFGGGLVGGVALCSILALLARSKRRAQIIPFGSTRTLGVALLTTCLVGTLILPDHGSPFTAWWITGQAVGLVSIVLGYFRAWRDPNSKHHAGAPRARP